jgi:RNA polymerase sigma-70 factor (sigma-E family)
MPSQRENPAIASAPSTRSHLLCLGGKSRGRAQRDASPWAAAICPTAAVIAHSRASWSDRSARLLCRHATASLSISVFEVWTEGDVLRNERDEQFQSFVSARRAELVRTATLLTAGDAHLAEDLVQSALTKLYLAWPAFRRSKNPNGYVYRTLVNALTDEWRRPWRRRERSTAELPDGAPAEPDRGSEAGDQLRQALKELPPRMRAALVFRYYHDLDVAATADALGCTPGTVKSQTARALDRLRAALEAASGSFDPISTGVPGSMTTYS